MSEKLKLGVFTTLTDNPEAALEKVANLGLPTCQMGTSGTEYYKEEIAKKVLKAEADYNVEITGLWAGCPGPHSWDFVDGPSTIGLVPLQYREMRVKALLAGVEFAKSIGVPAVMTHAGFIPENQKDPLYKGAVDSLRRVALKCKEYGIDFCFETGQETPITLLRAIKDIGTDNVGVNIDPANLLLYGKANPVDALDILGPYVKGVHAKDGEYPTDPSSLGKEKPLGQGRVNFPVFIDKLKSFGYNGPLTIEREISGEEQVKDIRKAIEVLLPLC